jgi:hypothetical protein
VKYEGVGLYLLAQKAGDVQPKGVHPMVLAQWFKGYLVCPGIIQRVFKK